MKNILYLTLDGFREVRAFLREDRASILASSKDYNSFNGDLYCERVLPAFDFVIAVLDLLG